MSQLEGLFLCFGGDEEDGGCYELTRQLVQEDLKAHLLIEVFEGPAHVKPVDHRRRNAQHLLGSCRVRICTRCDVSPVRELAISQASIGAPGLTDPSADPDSQYTLLSSAVCAAHLRN